MQPVRPISPHFDAQYIPPPAKTLFPARELILMIWPLPRRIIPGTTARLTRNTDLRFVTFETVVQQIELRSGREMRRRSLYPALFRQDNRSSPVRSELAQTREATCDVSVTSATTRQCAQTFARQFASRGSLSAALREASRTAPARLFPIDRVDHVGDCQSDAAAAASVISVTFARIFPLSGGSVSRVWLANRALPGASFSAIPSS